MELQDRRALLALALFAARADGKRDDKEGEAIRATLARIRGDGVEPELIWSEIESGWRKLDATVSELTAPETRALAYELAVCVCDADGATNEAERVFLAELAHALGVSDKAAQGFLRDADALAGAPLAAPAASAQGAGALDERILRQAILCGALELLPQRLATLAILPLQMRLVYQVGKHHGFELDRAHVTDFLGVAGVGLASQVIERFARQAASGILGKLMGGLVGGLGGTAAGAGMSFATTYALGHAAKRYYAGGRKLSAIEVKELFATLLGRARQLEATHAADIAKAAGSIDLASLPKLLSS
jgi:uncharacterized protein (DUF697 family)/tellurite resistance protein